MNISKSSDPEVQKSVALLSATEIGVGSLLHALHLPFAGHFLSLNQGLVLMMLVKKEKVREKAVSNVNAVSTTSSLMKSLSPAGKKLTPMLAISVQGFLFSIGIFLFGVNLVGVLLGMLLLSIWGFVQPLLIAYILFGSHFFDAVVKLWTEFCQYVSLPVENGLWVLLGVVLMKVLVSLVLAVLFWESKEHFELEYIGWLERVRKNSPLSVKTKRKRLGVNPWLLVSFAISIGYFFMSGQINAEGIWSYVLRPLAVTLVFFWLTAKIPYFQKLGSNTNSNF